MADDNTPGISMALGGNWTEDAGMEEKEPYDPSQAKIRYAAKTHNDIADQLYYEYLENEYGAPAFRFLCNLLFSEWKVEGPGAEAINNYFDKIDLTGRQEIWEAGLWTLINGNGFIYKVIKSGTLRQLKSACPYNFELSWASSKKAEDNEEAMRLSEYGDTSTSDEHRFIVAKYFAATNKGEGTIASQSQEYYFRQYPRYYPEDWRNDKLVLLQLEPELDGTPNGMSPIRAALHALKGLKMVNRNVLSAINQLLASILVVLYDTSGIRDDEKAAILKALSTKLKALNSATSGGLAIDKAHQIGYVGTLPGTSPVGDDRIIKVMDHIEPVLSAVLLNFLIPIGIIEQTGANKSLIAKQDSMMISQVNLYRNKVKTILKTQIFPHITKLPVEIRFTPHIEVETLAAMFQMGGISREFFQESLGILDDGEEYAPEEQIELQAKLKPVGTGNQDGSTSREPSKKYT